MGVGVYGNHLIVNLCLNSPEARAIFREKIMDSPAIRLEGPTEPSPNNQRYTSDTLGIHLYPEFSAYPYTLMPPLCTIQSERVRDREWRPILDYL